MSRPISSRRAVETVWQSVTDPSVDPEPSLAVLERRYERGEAVLERFAGQFYHLARGAYAAIARNDPSNAMAEFNETARYLMHDVMDVLDGTTYHYKTTDFYGVANELTPAAIAPMYLASREDDLYQKIDLLFNDSTQVIPVQMKTDECYTIAAAPKNGVLITAKDFGNEDFAVSQAIVEGETFPTSRQAATIDFARQALTECIYRRAGDQELQAAELAHKASQVRGPKFKKPILPPLLHRPFATDAMDKLAALLNRDLQSS